MSTVILSIFTLSLLLLILTVLLIKIDNKYANKSNKSNQEIIEDEINKLLPQTQCGQCNYPGCKPYAQAISKDNADINLCPPGGQAAIDNIAQLLNIESKPPLDKNTKEDATIKKVALIKEEECIGCLICIKACPVDAIIGANKTIHTVVSDKCTGCDLCIEPCPMDCITMIEVK